MFDVLSGWFVVFVIFTSGIVINFCQLLGYFMLFLSKKQRIAMAQLLAKLWWPLFDFFLEAWGHVPIIFHGDEFGKDQSGILISNHGPALDILCGISIAERGIGAGSMIALAKRSISFIPALGWTHYMQGSIFMKRDLETDKIPMALRCQVQ